MGVMLAWLMFVVPTSLTVGLAFLGWRRVRSESLDGMPLITSTMFIAAAATGVFVTLGLLALIGPWVLGQATPVTLTLDPISQEVFEEGSGYLGGYGSLAVLAGLDPSTVTLASLGLAAGYLPPAAIAALIGVASHAVLTERVIRPSVAIGAVITAAVCGVFGTAQQALSNLAASQAQFAVRDSTAGIGEGSFMMLAQVPPYNPWPVAAAVGFLALAAILCRGARIASQSRGLV